MSNKNFGDRPVSRPAQEKRQAGNNRPEHSDKIPRQAMFSTQGSTGWRRRRDLRNHKGNRTEDNFSHLHDKFADPEDVS